MADSQPNSSSIDDFLLDRFNEDDFASARKNLLQRYTSFHGVLISEDGESILTPDDIATFREHAADFAEQRVFSDYENEQLKILTVLIYQLLHASKGVGAITGKKSTFTFWQHFGQFYVFRKIFHHSHRLTLKDIKKLVVYQNVIFSLYQQSKQALVEDMQSPPMQSQDKQYFVIRIEKSAFSIQLTDAVKDSEQHKQPKQKTKSTKAQNRFIMLADQEKDNLLDTAKSTTLQCGVVVAAASYIGVKRKANEDGVVILPDDDQVTVIDGMGGYGNGAKARNLFCKAVIEHAGDIEQAIVAAQNNYDENDLGKGGVCVMNINITALDNNEYRLDLGQAGDVHLVAFDENFELQYESIDEAIGHKVINAIMGSRITQRQRNNGWSDFGVLTHNAINVKKGWRIANFSDGIANHFDAENLKKLITDCTTKTAIGRLSSRLNKLMANKNSYKDNCSITILDF